MSPRRGGSTHWKPAQESALGAPVTARPSFETSDTGLLLWRLELPGTDGFGWLPCALAAWRLISQTCLIHADPNCSLFLGLTIWLVCRLNHGDTFVRFLFRLVRVGKNSASPVACQDLTQLEAP